MDDDEAKNAYDGISKLLRELNLDWLVDQVEESIALGKSVTKEADASEFIDDKIGGLRRGRRKMQEFVTTEPFSSSECLNLLLDAIDRVLALPHFATETLNILEATSVTFISEQEGDDGRNLLRDPGREQEEIRRKFRELRGQTGVTAK